MKFAFYLSEGKSREERIVEPFAQGCKLIGDDFVQLSNQADPVDADVALMVGLKTIDLRHRCQALGQRVITFDKGYDRKFDWWRVSIDQHQPTEYLMSLGYDDARMIESGWKVKRWRDETDDAPVIIAGGGRKYYDACNLPDPADYIAEIVAGIRAAGCRRKIWYRPKPSMSDVVPVADTVLSRHKSIYEILNGAHALITYGSNACFEAMLAGVPSIVLGDAVARPISSRGVDEIGSPVRASDEERLSLLSNLAHCQFRISEIENGSAINELKTQLRKVVPGPQQQP